MNRLDHIGIYVKDIEKSLRFYEKVFDWKPIRQYNSGEAKIAVLTIGHGLIEIVQRPGSPSKAPDGNWSHIALHVDGWSAVIAKLEKMELELRKVTMADGSQIAFFKDPDGHMIEIMEKGFTA